jgi:hypothetical protein
MKSTTILALAKSARWIEAHPDGWEGQNTHLGDIVKESGVIPHGKLGEAFLEIRAALGLPLSMGNLKDWSVRTSASEASRQLWAIVAEAEAEDDGISDRFKLPPLDPRDEYRHPEDFNLPEWAEG